MKITNLMLCAVVAGVMALTAGKAAAQGPTTSLPLKLTSASGTAYVTASYDGKATTTPYAAVSFNYKTLLSVISATVLRNSGKIVPPNVDVVYDPISNRTYLTNSAGFHYNLNGIMYVYVYDTATSFSGAFYAGSESDITGVELEVYGVGPDGLYYEFDIYGTGKLDATYGGKLTAIQTKTSTVKMTMSLQNGSGYAEIQGSDDGVVSNGQFTFSGSGTAPSDAFPYSAWNND